MEVVKMPFGKYKDFDACVKDNQDKDSPEAYCAEIEHKITGKWPAEEKLLLEVEKMESEIKDKDNPIQANPSNPRNPIRDIEGTDNVPEMKEPAGTLTKEIEQVEDEIKKKEPGVRKLDGTGPLGGTAECPLTKNKVEGLSMKDYLKQKKEFRHQVR